MRGCREREREYVKEVGWLGIWFRCVPTYLGR